MEYFCTYFFHKFKFEKVCVHNRLLKTPEYSQYLMSYIQQELNKRSYAAFIHISVAGEWTY